MDSMTFLKRRNLSSRGEDFWVASLVVMHTEFFEASLFNALGVFLGAPSLISFGPTLVKGWNILGTHNTSHKVKLPMYFRPFCRGYNPFIIGSGAPP